MQDFWVFADRFDFFHAYSLTVPSSVSTLTMRNTHVVSKCHRLKKLSGELSRLADLERQLREEEDKKDDAGGVMPENPNVVAQNTVKRYDIYENSVSALILILAQSTQTIRTILGQARIEIVY